MFSLYLLVKGFKVFLNCPVNIVCWCNRSKWIFFFYIWHFMFPLFPIMTCCLTVFEYQVLYQSYILCDFPRYLDIVLNQTLRPRSNCSCTSSLIRICTYTIQPALLDTLKLVCWNLRINSKEICCPGPSCSKRC